MRAIRRRGERRSRKSGDGHQLDQLRRGLVAELQQAERGDQREQGAVGDGARVVDGLASPPKAKGSGCAASVRAR